MKYPLLFLKFIKKIMKFDARKLIAKWQQSIEIPYIEDKLESNPRNTIIQDCRLTFGRSHFYMLSQRDA